ncbi:hypothetical protein WMY93_022517 [Mugilogobius chulae]|uniref:Prokaryotic-type class I peptide chain release factors domain-containing protein n=1 Tax=Mugilogobius chulae TaxID=88201 RepID=A0AAW0NHT1_9GOBI
MDKVRTLDRERHQKPRYIRQRMEDFTDLDEKLQRAFLSESDRKTFVQNIPSSCLWRRRGKVLNKRRKSTTKCCSPARWFVFASDLFKSYTKDEDVQMMELLKEEEALLSQRITDLRKIMVKTLVPSDPLDCSDVILEVVSGRTTGGGLHHAAVRIEGDSVYRHLKHEGGTHRVQRIPEVGLSSRMQKIHTGTMTVIILPQPLECDVSIEQKDLRVDTFRSKGAGGQSVNTTDSAVRVVHLPTGISAECQQSRSQLQNRDTAMRMLKARLYQSIMGKETEQRHTARKQQVGTRSQSERIRTYNFSQDRVTDHRTGYTARDIKEFMRGGEALDDLIMDVLEHAEKDAVLDLVDQSLK